MPGPSRNFRSGDSGAAKLADSATRIPYGRSTSAIRAVCCSAGSSSVAVAALTLLITTTLIPTDAHARP